jgi:hypothetical protein
MAHRTVQCATGHYPVRLPRHLAVGFRSLELLSSGPPDRHYSVSGAPATSPGRWIPTVGASVFWATGQALFSVRCAIWLCSNSRILEGEQFGVGVPGASDSPVRQTRAHFG